MYPKKLSEKVKQSKKAKENLQKEQRQALKTLLSQKFQNKYNQTDPNVISSNINDLLKDGKNLTPQNLQKLDENLIKINNKKPNKRSEDYQENENENSRMSGASNFETIDNLCTKRLKNKKDAKQEQRDKEKLILNEKIIPNELEILNEQNEWAAIMKYNSFLYKSEENNIDLMKYNKKIKFCKDLADQIEEKKFKKQKEKDLEEKYFDNVRIQVKQEEEREKKKIEEYKNKIKIEKETRDRQMKEITNKKRFELKQEKALDAHLINSLKAELNAVKELTKARKEQKAILMQKILNDAEMKKERTRQEELNEKQEIIRLQEAYYNLIEEQEKTKEENIKKRDIMAKAFLINAENLKKQEYLKEVEKLDQRFNKYANRLEKQKDEEEKEKIIKAKEQKLKTREILENQIKQRESRDFEEKKIFNTEQVEMWQKEADNFYEMQNNMNNMKKQSLINYHSWVRDKIKEKTELKALEGLKINTYEDLINKKSLETTRSINLKLNA